MEVLKLYDISAIFNSIYSHIYRTGKGKDGEKEFGFRETWNSAINTLDDNE